jgi:hypothetical protein
LAGFAVISTATLVFAISCGAVAIGGTDPKAESMPVDAAKLAQFAIYYDDGTVDDSLIDFNQSRQSYKKSIAAENGHSSLTVFAEAVEKEATVLISWENKTSRANGGMDEAELNSAEFSDVPIPVSQGNGNTTITVKVTNNGAVFDFVVNFTPPTIDVSLSSLSVKIDDGDNLIAFNPNTLMYLVNPSNTNQADKPITVDATPSVESSTVVISNQSTNKVPLVGAAPLEITVTITNSGSSLVYTIRVLPPQSHEINDASLMSLMFEYEDGSQALSSFHSGTVTYGVQVEGGVTRVKLSNIKSTSDAIQNIVVTYGSGTTYNTTTAPLVQLPAIGSSAQLVFTIVVTAGDTTTKRTYTVTFTNPATTKTWSGTVGFDGSGGNKVIESVEAEIPNAAPQSGAVSENGTWSIQIDDTKTPANFVVVMSEDKGTLAVPKIVAYRMSFDMQESWTSGTGINLQVIAANASRMIYTPDDLADLGDPLNIAENWMLASDIDLNDYSGPAWDGPNNYRGTFDGKNYTINNLILSKTDSDTGLFDTLAPGAVIKNVAIHALTDPSQSAGLATTAGVHFGGVVGFIQTGPGEIKISNVTITGSLKYRSYSAYLIVGGLLGEISDINRSTVVIENCVSTLRIDAQLATHGGGGNHSVFGGLVGRADCSGADGSINIKNSYTTGDIIAVNMTNDYIFAGGIVGWYKTMNNTRMIIENCFTAGSVAVKRTVSSDNAASAGGILGGSESTSENVSIINCAALNPSVTFRAYSGTVGSSGQIMGSAKVNTVLTNNFSYDGMLMFAGTGEADATPNTSGALHNNEKGAPKTIANFKDIRTWTGIASAGTGGLGFSPAIWNFDNIAIDGYPKLR